MNPYVTGAVIKGLREERPHPGPAGRRLQVSDKAVSSGETAKGYPDITLIEAPGPGPGHLRHGAALRDCVTFTQPQLSNLLRAKWVRLPPSAATSSTAPGRRCSAAAASPLPRWATGPRRRDHAITVEPVEDEVYVTLNHPMKKGTSSPSWPGCPTKGSS